MRILTRGDFDGLICSVLLNEAVSVNGVEFTEPGLLQNREVEVTKEDIVVNLPFHPNCGMWFDHHISERRHSPKPSDFKGRYDLSPSCARLVFDYYKLSGWEEKYGGLIDKTDIIDSGQVTLNDILRPQGWLRISYTIDPRTGFAQSRKYFMDLMEWISQEPLEDIMRRPEVSDRVREYFKMEKEFKESLLANSSMNGKVVVTDYRQVVGAPLGSRFLVYALFPSAVASVRVSRIEDREKVKINVGHSVINRSCSVDVGSMMAEYGGGGHVGAGSCNVYADGVDDAVSDIVDRLGAGA